MMGKNFTFIIFSIFIISACKTVSLKPIDQNDEMLSMSPSDLNVIDGDYEIFSVDTSSKTLEYLLTTYHFYGSHQLPKESDRINIEAIDEKHLKVRVYNNGSIIKTAILKGNISENYFKFSRRSFVFYLFLNSIEKQHNRIGIYKNGDLKIDAANRFCFLYTIIPCCCTNSQVYNLRFKRKIENY